MKYSNLKNFRRICLATLIMATMTLFLGCSNTESSSIIYVNAESSADSPDGTLWSSAYTSLVEALGNATPGQEIWVAQGVYYPTDSTDRTLSFKLVPDVDVYGGFSGDETTRDDRDWEANETILSGNIGDASLSTDNSYHVVSGYDGAILDGFVIVDESEDAPDSGNEPSIETTTEDSLPESNGNKSTSVKNAVNNNASSVAKPEGGTPPEGAGLPEGGTPPEGGIQQGNGRVNISETLASLVTDGTLTEYQLSKIVSFLETFKPGTDTGSPFDQLVSKGVIDKDEAAKIEKLMPAPRS